MMYPRLIACVFVFLVFAGCCATPGPRFVRAEGESLVTGDGKPLLLRGVNLANWLGPEGYMLGFKNGAQSPHEIEKMVSDLVGPAEAVHFWRAYREAYINEDDIRFLHEAGLNSVRIPIYSKSFMPGDEEGFALLDRVIGWARKYDLYVILDMHAAPGGQTGSTIDDSSGYPFLFESPEDQALLIDIWTRIATRYRDNPTVLGYDLLNEPIASRTSFLRYNAMLEPLYKRIAAGIRRADSHHILILEGAQWATSFTVFSTPFDRNTLYSFHTYWTTPDASAIQPYLDFRARYHVPLWLGESGENSDAWIGSFARLLEEHQIGWAFWPYKKMAGGPAFVNWQKPAHWDEIAAYAGNYDSGKSGPRRLMPRPSRDHTRAALGDLLEKIDFRHCRINAGYLKALRLKVALIKEFQ